MFVGESGGGSEVFGQGSGDGGEELRGRVFAQPAQEFVAAGFGLSGGDAGGEEFGGDKPQAFRALAFHGEELFGGGVGFVFGQEDVAEGGGGAVAVGVVFEGGLEEFAFFGKFCGGQGVGALATELGEFGAAEFEGLRGELLHHRQGAGEVAFALADGEGHFQGGFAVFGEVGEVAEFGFGVVPESDFEIVAGEFPHGALSEGGGEVFAGDDSLVDAEGALVFAASAEEFADGELEFHGLGVHGLCFQEGVEGAVVFVAEEVGEAAEVGAGEFVCGFHDVSDVQSGGEPAEDENDRQEDEPPFGDGHGVFFAAVLAAGFLGGDFLAADFLAAGLGAAGLAVRFAARLAGGFWGEGGRDGESKASATLKRSWAPALKRGSRRARISIISPVWGFRPRRAGRWRTKKVPKPRSSTRPPRARWRAMSAKTRLARRAVSSGGRSGFRRARIRMKSERFIAV